MIVSGTHAVFFDVSDWRFRLSRLERQACLIEQADGRPLGTGFLVGPDVVMTVGHVFPFNPKHASHPPVKIQARFDYHQSPASGEFPQGRKVGLADEGWLLGWAPPSNGTEQKSVDTAVIRLSEPPGLDALDGTGGGRGWVDLTVSRDVLEKGSGLAILGHPEGGPLKLSMNTQSVIGYDPEDGYLMYRTDTLPGNSGAPCFDLQWNFAAMHQGRSASQGNHNRGIPFPVISNWLKAENLWDLVTQKSPEPSASTPAMSASALQSRPGARYFGLPLDLKNLMKSEGEGELLEYKVSWAKARDPVFKTIAAFMNSRKGGTLLLGVDDQGNPVGIDGEFEEVNAQKANWDGFSLALIDSLDKLDLGGNAQQYIRVERYAEENKTICVIRVEPSHRPVFFGNKFYQRIGNQSRLVEGHKMLDYIARRWSWIGSAVEE